MTFSHRTLPVVALGATLLFTGACNASAGGSGAAGAPPSASAPSGNTAEICKSGGEAARTAVLELFSKMAETAKGGDEPGQAELVQIYQSTFGTLRDDLRSSGAKATDPEFAAVLTAIAAEADKLAQASDPEAAGTQGFEDALAKLEKYCPSGTPGASTAPGGVVNGTVGAKGSGCELPVTFAVAAKWEPKAVEFKDDDPLAELARRGPLRMACEISAKGAGLVGFLRVWIDPAATGDARAALKALLKGEKTRKAAYQPVTIGGRDGMELTYQTYSELLEEYSDRRAFAVPTPGGAVVVELSGVESDDPAMQSAYEQARSTLTVNP
jgi:hypothetical protein